jgi:uncharacterized membrane protein YfcA
MILALASILAGAIASVSGFGIGSILTPLLARETGMRLAVAAVSIPHLAGTALRFWKLRRHVDRATLKSFGAASAVGGLAGALLNSAASNRALELTLGVLLVFAGLTGITGLAARMRFGRRMGAIAGAVSGLLGGLVGNQGGIRSAALLGFDLSRESFVATATAIALIIDGVRMPVYLVKSGGEIAAIWPRVATAVAGVLVGTLVGQRILGRIPELVFRRVVSGLILALGISMLAR